MQNETTHTIKNVPLEHLRNIFGQFDRFEKQIEDSYNVSLVVRDDELKINGEEPGASQAEKVLRELLRICFKLPDVQEGQVKVK